jgi:replicative DNA helicase
MPDAVLSDEGEICSVIAGRYGGSFEVFLKAHNGQVLTIERQGRARVHVRKPALTLGLAVQPDVLQSLIAKRHVRERGLLVAVPRSNVGYRAIAPSPVPERVIESYDENVRRLLEQPDQLDEYGELRTTVLTLSEKAQEFFTRFEAEVEVMLRPDARLGSITSWGSKLTGGVGRIAGLLWIAEKRDGTTVDVATMRKALAIGEYLIPHALAAFDRTADGAELNCCARQIMTDRSEI